MIYKWFFFFPWKSSPTAALLFPIHSVWVFWGWEQQCLSHRDSACFNISINSHLHPANKAFCALRRRCWAAFAPGPLQAQLFPPHAKRWVEFVCRLDRARESKKQGEEEEGKEMDKESLRDLRVWFVGLHQMPFFLLLSGSACFSSSGFLCVWILVGLPAGNSVNTLFRGHYCVR